MKRLGLIHKPMIIGLKANVSAIAETYRTAYPQAKVLYAGAKDYSAKERVEFFNKMTLLGDRDDLVGVLAGFLRLRQGRLDGLREDKVRPAW